MERSENYFFFQRARAAWRAMRERSAEVSLPARAVPPAAARFLAVGVPLRALWPRATFVARCFLAMLAFHSALVYRSISRRKAPMSLEDQNIQAMNFGERNRLMPSESAGDTEPLVEFKAWRAWRAYAWARAWRPVIRTGLAFVLFLRSRVSGDYYPKGITGIDESSLATLYGIADQFLDRLFGDFKNKGEKNS